MRLFRRRSGTGGSGRVQRLPLGGYQIPQDGETVSARGLGDVFPDEATAASGWGRPCPTRAVLGGTAGVSGTAKRHAGQRSGTRPPSDDQMSAAERGPATGISGPVTALDHWPATDRSVACSMWIAVAMQYGSHPHMAVPSRKGSRTTAPALPYRRKTGSISPSRSAVAGGIATMYRTSSGAWRRASMPTNMRNISTTSRPLPMDENLQPSRATTTPTTSGPFGSRT